MDDASTILTPCYIVLDVPSPMAEKVRAFRTKFDFARSLMPAEITLTGSSGAGLVRKGQTVDFVASEMEKVAKKFPPFAAKFASVERFSNTDIYFLTLEDASPFEALNEAFLSSGIVFEPVLYPYRPHCTLKLRSAPSDPELLELMFLDVPKEEFVLDSISLYSLPDASGCDLLARSALSGVQERGGSKQ